MRSLTLLLAGLALAPAAGFARPAANRIAVAAHGDTAIDLSLGKLDKRIDLAGSALSPALASARTLFESDQPGRHYLVLDVSGPTTPHGGSEECGAGSESSLVWMELSDKLSPLRIEAVAYDSCLRNANAALDVTRHGLHAEFEYSEEYRDGGMPKMEWIKCSADYDAAFPERGLDVRRAVVQPQP